MKSYLRVATAATFAVVTCAPAFAGPVGVARPSPAAQTVERLEQAREQVVRERSKPNVRGPLLVRYITRKAQLDDLIARIKSGRPVAPDEVEEALAR
jgi:hypothetical protein